MAVVWFAPPTGAKGAPRRQIAQGVDLMCSVNTCICPERGQKAAARLGRAPR
ncbi:MAG: hypothetical protein RML36_02385 [Anaerolineae bacterium]|nr:hypothetical protein [Anaerolineae bacterium]MDW8098316.1 hypothetical protein [Anaerolineae bacterium]